MTTEKKERQPRTPASYDSIERGALKLPIGDKVKLRNKLIDEIAKEVEQAKLTAENFQKLANGVTP